MNELPPTRTAADLIKPGWRSTELWIIPVVIAVLTESGALDGRSTPVQIALIACVTALAVAYIASRSYVKRSAAKSDGSVESSVEVDIGEG